jgi:hypothetical protein|tara:strand:+ start:656 stop:841 length:186 start_codon:yes stop_codon:yes gene_type:complete
MRHAARFEALDRDTAGITVAPLLRARSWLAMSQQREDCDIAELASDQAKVSVDQAKVSVVT